MATCGRCKRRGGLGFVDGSLLAMEEQWCCGKKRWQVAMVKAAVAERLVTAVTVLATVLSGRPKEEMMNTMIRIAPKVTAAVTMTNQLTVLAAQMYVRLLPGVRTANAV